MFKSRLYNYFLGLIIGSTGIVLSMNCGIVRSGACISCGGCLGGISALTLLLMRRKPLKNAFKE
jgi:hypothetical protein